jgi:transposase
VWETVFKELAGDADHEYAMIDRTIVRAHQHSAGALKKTVRRRSGEARGA